MHACSDLNRCYHVLLIKVVCPLDLVPPKPGAPRPPSRGAPGPGRPLIKLPLHARAQIPYTKIEVRVKMGSVGLRLFMFMVATAVIYGTRGTEKDRICTNHGYY